MLYDRKIKYLEDIRNGERVRGAGFVKIEVRDSLCRMNIHVSGLHETDSFEKPVLLVHGDKEGLLCRIKLAGGRGDTGELCLDSASLGENRISYEELEEIRIPIAAGRELRCILREKAASGNHKTETAVDEKKKMREKEQAVPENSPMSGEPAQSERVAGAEGVPQPGRVADAEKSSQMEYVVSAKEAPQPRYAADAEERPQPGRVVGAEERPQPGNVSGAEEYPQSGNAASAEELARPGKIVSTEKPPQPERTARTEELQQPRRAARAEEFSQPEKAVSIEEPPRPERTARTEKSQQPKRAAGAEKPPQPEETASAEIPPQADAAPSAVLFPLEDKWRQLSAIYPHTAPFGDERNYLSLEPGDFVIFPSRYYKLVNNSFLLHGYHNYEHLILTRMEYRGEVRYYIGVPGNYYEKEKQVALMFGFESFECKREPAQPGDYGYYMMRVEL